MVHSYYYNETKCLEVYKRFAPFYHLFSQENFEIIFDSDDARRAGMSIFGICSKINSDVNVFCFELMSNHYHAVISGKYEAVLAFAGTFSEMLSHYFKDTRPFLSEKLLKWNYEIRPVESLNDVRNVIAYSNRNGFLVNNDVTPFNYPWGSNRCYFSPDAVARYADSTCFITVREIRQLLHSAKFDSAAGMKKIDGHISPFAFSRIKETEDLFRDVKQYLFLNMSKIEEIDSISGCATARACLSDDEACEKARNYCADKFRIKDLSEVTKEQAMDVADYMRMVLHSSDKQIMRILGMSSRK